MTFDIKAFWEQIKGLSKLKMYKQLLTLLKRQQVLLIYLLMVFLLSIIKLSSINNAFKKFTNLLKLNSAKLNQYGKYQRRRVTLRHCGYCLITLLPCRQ